MTPNHNLKIWISLFAAAVLFAGLLALIVWQKQKPISLKGAVIVQDADPRKQLPIAGVTITAADLAGSESTSNTAGYFSLKLPKLIRKGQHIDIQFRHPEYHPFDLNTVVGSDLYIVHLSPLPSPNHQPEVKIGNVRVRYTLRSMTQQNIGSAVKTFEVENKGNVPCKGQPPCSPDGRWKATVGSASLDAGADNEFRDASVSCIAGPCPFTKIDADHFSAGGQTISVLARAWSDTATFLLEAEVFRHMVTQKEYWSYPVIFGQGLSFTLPSTAGSESIEAELDGQTIIFPLGPALFLSWATCDAETKPDKPRVYRCAAKPGYRFQ